MKKSALILAALAAFCAIAPVHAEEFHRTISVTGTGKVTAKNDRATVRVNVETKAKDSKEAARENARIMSDVKYAVIEAGANAQKIETLNYTMAPVYRYNDKGKQIFETYKATNTMKIEVNDIDKTGEVMDAATKAGATRVDSVEFSVSHPERYRDEALEKATADAKRKADLIAANLGRTVVNVISVNEDMTPVYQPRLMMMKAAAMGANAMDEVAVTPVEGGDSDMEYRVSIVFEIA